MLDYDSVIRKKVDVPNGVFFEACPGALDREICIMAGCIDSYGMRHALITVTDWFVMPSGCGQGELNALIKRNLRGSILCGMLAIEVAELKTRGFAITVRR